MSKKSLAIILAITGLTAITACNPSTTTEPIAGEPAVEPIVEPAVEPAVEPIVEPAVEPAAPAVPPPPVEPEHELVDFTPNPDAEGTPWMIRELSTRAGKEQGWAMLAENTRCMPDNWQGSFLKFWTAGDDPKVKDRKDLSELGKWKRSFSTYGCKYRDGMNYAMFTAFTTNVRKAYEEYDKCRLEGGTRCMAANPDVENGIELIWVETEVMTEKDWYLFGKGAATRSNIAATARNNGPSNTRRGSTRSKAKAPAKPAAPATGNGVVQ